MEGWKGRRERKFPVVQAPLIQSQAGMRAEAVSLQSPFSLDLRFGSLGLWLNLVPHGGLVMRESLWVCQ